MLDHVSLPVADLVAAATFYDAVLPTIGLERHKEFPGGIGYGLLSEKAPAFWILAETDTVTAKPGTGLHISFIAPDRSSVDAFHAVAISHGAKDAGKPGDRPEYKLPYYGAFVLDLDGFKIEAVCRH
jgi:catechol 2,3-dioxygenase-like lactoylglutathione lyase family enzyme